MTPAEVRSAVESLLYRCARGFDEDDIELMADCYAEAAELISPDGSVLVGRDAIRAAMRERQALRFGRGEHPRHVITNVEILESSERSLVTSSYFMLLTATPDGIAIATKGAYRDRLADDGGQWRIAHREVRLDPAFESRG